MILQALKKRNRNIVNRQGTIGLEIETEARQEYALPKFSFWTVTRDGSLRNFGIEYVLKNPLGISELKLALEEFKEKTKAIDFIKDSITTSVHVHVNMLNETFLTLGNFFVLYTLVENILVRYSGENRRSNGFSLPICDAEETYQNMKEILNGISHKDYGPMFIGDDVAKYAGINLAALGKFGSLEIRLFRGETDPDVILEWVSILDCILQYSKAKGVDPHSMILKYKANPSAFLQAVFKKYYPKLKLENEENLANTNFIYAANLAYAIKDWSRIDKKATKEKAKREPNQADRIARFVYEAEFENLNAQQQREIMILMEENFQIPVQPANLEVRQEAQGNARANAAEIIANRIGARHVPPGWRGQARNVGVDPFEHRFINNEVDGGDF